MFNLFYRNRRLLILVLALIVVGGLSAAQVLPRLEDPTLEQRAAKINTRFPGASAVRVESLVTEKIEQSLKEIEEIRVVRSASWKELSTITMELHDYVDDVDEVWSRVRNKLSDIEPQLPPGAERPQYEDIPFRAYALLVALTWDRDEPVQYAILRRQTEELEQRLRRVFGTDVVDLFGEPFEEVTVRIDPDRLAGLNLTVDEVAGALQSSDAKVSAGALRSVTSELVIELGGEFTSLADIARTPIKLDANQRLVRLADVAEIEKGIQLPPRTKALVNGRPAIVLGCLVQPDLRVDLWTRDAIEVVEQFEADLPSGIGLTVILEQNQYVMDRLTTLLTNLILASLAVTAVIFLMMGWRSALVVGCTLPLAGLMVLSGLRLLDIPLQQMSVTGLIIALGLLIDNAIVIVDETRSWLRRGWPPGDAITKAVRHLVVPLAGSTFTTALAFSPLALMPGPAGEFVGSIGISVILAIGSSLFLSMTVIPALLGLIERGEQLRRARHWWQAGFGGERLYRLYREALDQLFKRPVIGLLFGVALPIYGYLQMAHLEEQFFPPSDRNQFQITLTMPSHTSLAETERMALAIRDRALELPEIKRLDWFLGESAPAFYYNMLPLRSGVPRYAQAFVEVDPDSDVQQVVRRLQRIVDSEFTTGHVLVKQLEQGPPVDAPIQLRLYGNDLNTLRELGEQVRSVAEQIPSVLYTQSDLSNTAAQLTLEVDEDQARQVGLSNVEIARQIEAALDGIRAGSLLEDTEELPVRVRWSDAERGDTRALNSLELIAPGGQGGAAGTARRIPLASIGRWVSQPSESTIERHNGQRINEVQVTVEAGVLASSVLNEFQRRWEQAGIELPPGYSLAIAGEAEERNRAISNLLANVGVLAVLMLATLVLSFQSFRIAGLIGCVALLSAGVGFAALSVFGYPFGFTAIVGIMGLIGVAINDSIVVLAAIRKYPAAAAGEPRAVAQVVFRATRHVTSTTLTTIAGFTPLLIAGGGFWPPLAIAVAGGVSGATILALYFVPSAYILLNHRGASRSVDIGTTQGDERFDDFSDRHDYRDDFGHADEHGDRDERDEPHPAEAGYRSAGPARST